MITASLSIQIMAYQYPPFLPYGPQQHYIADCNQNNPTAPSPGVDHLHDADRLSQPRAVADVVPVPAKRRSRLVPTEEKDATYYEKRARNNESAKRSRDSRRFKEQQIQERADFLQHENSRLTLENQTIRYQLSQLHLFYNGMSKA